MNQYLKPDNAYLITNLTFSASKSQRNIRIFSSIGNMTNSMNRPIKISSNNELTFISRSQLYKYALKKPAATKATDF